MTCATDRALIDRFLEMMAAEAGAAPNTLAAYRSDLMLASQALEGNLVDADAAALATVSGGWSALSRATVGRKSASLRRFFAFLAEEGHRADDPGKALPRPGPARALPKVLSHADIDRLFAAIAERAARDPLDPNDLRLSALFELLYGSGLRATELVSLPRNAVHPDRPFLILRGKGGRERMVPISDRARAAVASWRAHVAMDRAWLFPSGRTHLSRIRLYQVVKALAADDEPPRRAPGPPCADRGRGQLLALGVCQSCGVDLVGERDDAVPIGVYSRGGIGIDARFCRLQPVLGLLNADWTLSPLLLDFLEVLRAVGRPPLGEFLREGDGLSRHRVVLQCG